MVIIAISSSPASSLRRLSFFCGPVWCFAGRVFRAGGTCVDSCRRRCAQSLAQVSGGTYTSKNTPKMPVPVPLMDLYEHRRRYLEGALHLQPVFPQSVSIGPFCGPIGTKTPPKRAPRSKNWTYSHAWQRSRLKVERDSARSTSERSDSFLPAREDGRRVALPWGSWRRSRLRGRMGPQKRDNRTSVVSFLVAPGGLEPTTHGL